MSGCCIISKIIMNFKLRTIAAEDKVEISGTRIEHIKRTTDFSKTCFM